MQLSRDDFATISLDSGRLRGRRGLATEWTPPTGSLTSGASYSWRVRVKYGTDKAWSEWSSPIEFTFGSPKVESGSL